MSYNGKLVRQKTFTILHMKSISKETFTSVIEVVIINISVK